MSEHGKWRRLVAALWLIALVVFAMEFRYEVRVTGAPDNDIGPITSGYLLDRWTGRLYYLRGITSMPVKKTN